MATDIVFVYMTAPNVGVAKQLGQLLVEKRLAACVNILDGMQSMYWWEDAVQTETETVLIAKTRSDLYADLETAIIAAHPYECPCILALPVQSGFKPFLDWVTAEAQGESLNELRS